MQVIFDAGASQSLLHIQSQTAGLGFSCKVSAFVSFNFDLEILVADLRWHIFIRILS